MSAPASLQDRYAPENRCFGCGPANEKGLRLKSRVRDDGVVVATFRPEPHHLAFEGFLCGGIIGTLLDCHMNWTAAHAIMRRGGDDSPPATVTASYRVDMRRPTPIDQPVELAARTVETSERKARIEATLSSGGEVTARGEGTFVAVSEGHPAFGRW